MNRIIEDLDILERCRIDFETRGRRCARRGDHIAAEDCFENAGMFARVVSVIQAAEARGDTPDLVSVRLSRSEWLALTTALRRDSSRLQALGTSALLTIAHIEGTLARNTDTAR